jgi:three-Cys-motif partner protein
VCCLAKIATKVDADGLIVSEVGEWAPEKHARVQRYVEITSGARAGYVPPPAWRGGASYIELFCGPGRSLIRGTKRIIDGSPLIACKAAQASGVPFTEMHLNDFDPVKVAAVEKRLRALGGNAVCYSAPADIAVDTIVAAVKPSGLHFAFLDPYNLEALSFDIISTLSKLQRVDMLIHVSVQDLQRNLDEYSKPGGVLDRFAPRWRNHVDPKQAIKPFRAALMKYWMGEIRKLGTKPAKGVELIVGSKGQRLYWLVFVSKHSLGQKLWEAIRDPMRQTRMDV